MSSPFAATPCHHRLRQRLEEHNRQVFAFTCLTAAGAILLWILAYGAAWWIMLFLLSAALGGSTHPPLNFTRWFLVVAALGLLAAQLHRWAFPDERPRDHKTAAEIALDFLLAIPRVTLAIWGNLSAWQKLNPAETEQAVLLLERLERGRILLGNVPQEVPDDALREHLLHTLQIIQLVEVRKEDGEYWLKLVPASAEGESRAQLE